MSKQPLLKDYTKFKLRYKGQLVYASVSPCSWMYRGYGLQLQLSLKENGYNAESVFTNDKSFDCYGIPVEDITPKAQSLAVTYLQTKGLEPLQKALDFWAAAEKKWEETLKEEEAQLLRDHAKAKAKGYTHYIIGWVHNTGDDYQVGAYTAGVPTEAQIKKLLKWSVVKTDYIITEL